MYIAFLASYDMSPLENKKRRGFLVPKCKNHLIEASYVMSG
jgi:hypothetical protein